MLGIREQLGSTCSVVGLGEAVPTGLSVHSGVESRQCPLLWSLQLRSSSHLRRSQCPLRGWEQAVPTALELAVAVLFTLGEVSVSTQGLGAGSAHCSGACSCGPLHTWGGLSVHSGVGSRQCPLLWSLQLWWNWFGAIRAGVMEVWLQPYKLSFNFNATSGPCL